MLKCKFKIHNITDHPKTTPCNYRMETVHVVVIAQQLFSYRQLSRLMRMALTVEKMFYGVWCHVPCAMWCRDFPLHTPDRHLICRWWCGPCNCSKADSDCTWKQRCIKSRLTFETV